MDTVSIEIKHALREVGYDAHIIRITDLMKSPKIKIQIDKTSFYQKAKSTIRYANQVRKIYKNKAAMAGIAIGQIRKIRKSITGDWYKPASRNAYIIRQFKRPEEIEILRKTYGRKFIQVSVFSTEEERKINLIEQIKNFNHSTIEHSIGEQQAIDLIKIDFDEKEEDGFGQKISDVFHLGDVFIRGAHNNEIKSTAYRFINALFGHNGISPTKFEYGMYMCAAAALRSIDLSRQVGATVFSSNGEIISMGCNEVPKAFGGTYWEDDPANEKHRDFEIGQDANHARKMKILYDLVERLGKEGFLSRTLTQKREINDRLDAIYKKKTIRDAHVMDIIEYGRMIHAEMSALMDAARTGKSTKNCTLFCTTFPCHICAKHIVAAGISRVVFLEPYPKSYASELHSDSISFRPEDIEKKVVFEPFIGISPRRYRDIFEKRKRKDGDGRAVDWYFEKPKPMIEDTTSNYMNNELEALAVALAA